MSSIDFNTATILGVDAAQRKLGIPSKFAPLLMSIVAIERIPAFVPVTSLGRCADSNNPSASFSRVVGISTSLIESGKRGDIVVSGEVENPAWSWANGAMLFLNGKGLCYPWGFRSHLESLHYPGAIVLRKSQFCK